MKAGPTTPASHPLPDGPETHSSTVAASCTRDIQQQLLSRPLNVKAVRFSAFENSQVADFP
jgi:hypothetical protein